ncbi:hypothetical protein DV737_g1268, partial [Chaetothyriales sp. CBS 132003]
MTESGKPSEDARSHPPPPTDPFTRFSQPWPRSEKDNENPFIQFRRFADESFNSFFSSLPSMFNSFQRAGQDFHSTLERQLEEQLKRSAEMEEAVRKEIEHNLEEMRQAFNTNQPERLQETLKTEPESIQQPVRPWWSGGRHRCPTRLNKDDQAKTELDAYEHTESPQDTKVDTAPYKWASSLGWDGKVQKSLEQALEQAWPKNNKNQQEKQQSPNEPYNDTRLYCRRHTVDMDPITEPLNTIPWLVLSPYSPVYLCNPDQPSAVLARFSTNLKEPFSMEVLRYKYRSISDRDLDEKLAHKLPWADAFEDLISLEQTGKMIDRDASTHKTPATWLHDMVKRGSLGSTWGLTHTGQLAVQHHPWLTVAEQQVESSDAPLSRAKTTAEKPFQMAEEAADIAAAQSVLDAVRSQRAQNSSDLLNDPTPGKVEELSDGADECLPGAIVQQQYPSPSLPVTQESTWSSSSTTWSSHSSHSYGSGSEENDEMISETMRTETKTLPDGSVQTKTTRKRRFADGREETEENVEFMPSPMRHQAEKQSQISATPVQDALKKQNESKGKKGGWFWSSY